MWNLTDAGFTIFTWLLAIIASPSTQQPLQIMKKIVQRLLVSQRCSSIQKLFYPCETLKYLKFANGARVQFGHGQA